MKISPRTLQTLRDNGTLAYTQICHKTYYKPEDVESIIWIVEERRKRVESMGRSIGEAIGYKRMILSPGSLNGSSNFYIFRDFNRDYHLQVYSPTTEHKRRSFSLYRINGAGCHIRI